MKGVSCFFHKNNNSPWRICGFKLISADLSCCYRNSRHFDFTEVMCGRISRLEIQEPCNCDHVLLLPSSRVKASITGAVILAFNAA